MIIERRERQAKKNRSQLRTVDNFERSQTKSGTSFPKTVSPINQIPQRAGSGTDADEVAANEAAGRNRQAPNELSVITENFDCAPAASQPTVPEPREARRLHVGRMPQLADFAASAAVLAKTTGDCRPVGAQDGDGLEAPFRAAPFEVEVDAVSEPPKFAPNL